MCIHECVCRFIRFCDHVCVYMRAYESERASLDVVYQSLPTFSPFKTGSRAGRKYLFRLGSKLQASARLCPLGVGIINACLLASYIKYWALNSGPDAVWQAFEPLNSLPTPTLLLL